MKSLYNSGSSYGPISKFFHWVIFVLVLCMFIVGYLMADISNKDLQGIAYNSHKLLGLTILGLIIFRIIWTLTTPKPDPLTNSKWWEKVAERTVHWALYLGLLIMPLSGWIGSSSAGKPPRYGLTAIHLPIAKNETLINACFWIHNNLALILIGLVTLHVLAAFYHYFIKKDNILQRMWP